MINIVGNIVGSILNKNNSEVILTITSVDSISNVNTDYGTAFGSLGLPSSININLSNATSDTADIDWNEEEYDANSTGIQTITGVLTNLPEGVTNPSNLEASVQITVNTIDYGLIHQDNFDGDLSAYTVTAPTSTMSIVGSNLRLSAGDGDFNNYMQLTDSSNVFNVHMLEKWRMRATFIAPTPNTTVFGFGLGVRSVGSHSDMDNIIRIDFSTGSAGTYVGTTWFYTAVNHSASPNGDFNNSDPDYIVGGNTYVLEVIREKNVLISNVYDSDGTTLLYTRSKTYNITTASAVNLHNAGRFCIWNFGGTIDITNLTIDTEAQIGCDVVALGDSNMHGMYAETNARRYVEQACNSLSLTFEIVAGVDAGSADGQAVVDGIIALDPKVCYINIVQNDEANGVADATYQANLASIVSDLEAEGITCIIGIPSARDGVDVAGIKSHVDSVYAAYTRVDLFTATKNIGDNNLQNSLEVGDNIHLDEDGNDTCAGILETSLDEIF